MNSGWSTILLPLRSITRNLTTIRRRALYGMGTHGSSGGQEGLKLHRKNLSVNKGSASMPIRRLMKKPLGHLAPKRLYAKLVIAQFPVAGAVPSAPRLETAVPPAPTFSSVASAMPNTALQGTLRDKAAQRP
jgi:hypothetical protein